MRIMICDNDYDFIKNEMDAIENYCARSNLQVSFDVYISPSNLLATNVKEIQVIFMESVFSNTDGVSLAKQLRSQNRDAIIIFITDNDKCAIEGYKVQAFRYILKSKWKEEFNDLMDALVSRLYIESQSIKLKTDEGEEIIPIKNIIYIEGAGGRKTLLHTTINSEPLECRSSLSNLGEILSDKGFIRLQRSYLANMKYIKRIKSYTATMSNGDVIRTSVKKYRDILKRYNDWKSVD